MIVGVDPGERRVGVAVADYETRFARPLEVIDTKTLDPVARIVEIVKEIEADKVVVGRATDMKGRAGVAVENQRAFLEALTAACDVEVVEHDERLTSVIADRALRDAGKSAKDARGIRDAVAAQILLQDYLDSNR